MLTQSLLTSVWKLSKFEIRWKHDIPQCELQREVDVQGKHHTRKKRKERKNPNVCLVFFV